MLTRLITTAAVAAVLGVCAPANAQLLGGVGGGLTGSVGGSLGGTVGGLGGATGSLTGSARATGGLDTATVVSRTRDSAGNAVTVTRDARGRLFATTRNARGRVISKARVRVEDLAAITGRTTDVVAALPVAVPAPPVVLAPPSAVVEIGRRDAIIASGVTVLRPGQADVYMDRQIVELRRELAGTDVDVVRRGQEIVLVLPSDITFAFDKAEIQPRFRPVLDAVARTLNAYPSTYVDVTGHADAVGTDAYNQRLSERRADAVRGYLERRGALPQRLHAEGRGEQDPVATNATVSGRAANRRVEIELTPLVG